MRLNRVPVIVIGAGVSAGAGVPTMNDVHKYLAERIGNPPRDTGAEVAGHLLETLRSDQTVAPRSVAVRLYRLLQAGQDKDLTNIWAKFGSDLLDGQIKQGGKALSKVEPTGAHKWAARLALSGRAIVVSLNYDGLTRSAIRQLAPTFKDRAEPRILSDEHSIRLFFTGEESKPRVTAIPVIKFRGDVFHAVCENGRCPSCSKLQPLYELFGGESSGKGEAERSNGRSSSTSALLRCADCDLERRLQLTFPGVAEKEHQITSAVAALHQFCGNRIAGVIFLGFSGRWDEALTRYLTSRARSLKAPTVSVSVEETRFIESSTEEAQIIEPASMTIEQRYRFCPTDFTQDKESQQALESILSPDELSEPYEHSSRTKGEVSFPYDAFRVFGKPGERVEKIEVKLPHQSNGATKLIVNSSKAYNDFTQVAASALECEELKRLGRCLQLGPKGIFLREPTAASHNRLEHSAEDGLIAWIWFEALLPQARGWAASSDARLALEMAVLFHDARHLPFSHMMEEVFRELNWAEVSALECPDFSYLSEAIKRTAGAHATPENWWTRVEAIQKGRSGVPWLEAIVDSALDADKIAYVFNDALLTGQGVRLAGIRPWIDDFLIGQHLTDEGLIRLEDASCEAALAILQERMHLYRTIYLTPELRGLESVVRYIVTTWLEWKVPERLGNLLTDNTAGSAKTTRELKTMAASQLLWEKFNRLRKKDF